MSSPKVSSKKEICNERARANLNFWTHTFWPTNNYPIKILQGIRGGNVKDTIFRDLVFMGKSREIRISDILSSAHLALP